MIVYIDDNLVYSHNLEEHVFQVSSVLVRLWEHSLHVQVEKWQFHLSSVSFLGYVIMAEGIHMEDGKVQAILGWLPPKTIKDLQRFLWFANYCQVVGSSGTSAWW